jgi:hypothetical protein
MQEGKKRRAEDDREIGDHDRVRTTFTNGDQASTP